MDFSNLRIVDLSVPLEHMAASEPLPAKIHYVGHADKGLAQMQQFFGVTPADLVYSGGQGWAVEEIQAITHTGTHVDAPYHYGATSEGKPARTIDHVPLEWCFAPGVVLDMRHKAAGDLITVDDLSESLKRISYTLKPLDIVLLQTGADARLGSPEYFRQPGLGREGVLWLVEQGMRVIGIDAYTLDRPFADMVADFHRTGDGRHIWPAHFAGLIANTARSKNWLTWTRSVGPTAFLCLLARQHKAASAGWCRAVALVPN